MTKQEIEARMSEYFEKFRAAVRDAQKVDEPYKHYFRGHAGSLSVTTLIVHINSKTREYRQKLRNILEGTDEWVEKTDFSYLFEAMEEDLRGYRSNIACFARQLPYNPL